MSIPMLFLAELSADTSTALWAKLLGLLREHLSLAGTLSAVILLAVVWVAFLYKDGRRHSHHHSHHHSHQHGLEPADRDGEDASEPHKHRKWRRRRREHRPRNPTLAETGGLPPLRRDPPSATPS
jgi:hypothetical protein